MNELLLHTCCAPCASGCIERLFAEEREFTLYFSNSNIGSREEFEKRLDAVNKLVEYNLVCEAGRLDAPGRPLLFGTTEEFLRRFSIHSIEDLPGLNPEQMEHFKTEAEEEVQLKLDI